MRHRWSEPARYIRHTERTCLRCGMIKTTRHEPGEWPWLEWTRADGATIHMNGTPPCEPVNQMADQTEDA